MNPTKVWNCIIFMINGFEFSDTYFIEPGRSEDFQWEAMEATKWVTCGSDVGQLLENP